MNWKFKEIYSAVSSARNIALLKRSKHGLERECLRVNKKSSLAMTPHPKALGAALTNPNITTDFSESQLELVTPTFNTERKASDFLRDIHVFVDKNLPNEYLWPLSMPCHLPSEKSIPIGQYGSSDTGKHKTDYRLGLAHRYGKKMQTVSGTHYNFSFSEDFWKVLQKKFAPKTELQDFISEGYFKIIRNFLRLGWINTYLFGASPTIDCSYCKRHRSKLTRKGWGSCYGPHATSMRMSQIGYYSKVQNQNAISFNSLEDYLSDMHYCINTKSKKYKGLPGLNENILQIENEHYSRIRPKQIMGPRETPSQALKERGVKYIEIRALDLNPYCEIGINCSQLRFLHSFLLYCLLIPSPALSKSEQREIFNNQNLVSMQGRKPKLKIKQKGKAVDMRSSGKKLLKQVLKAAELLDKAHKTASYSSSLKYQLEKIDDVEKTTSARILKDVMDNRLSHSKFGFNLAKEHKEILDGETLSPTKLKKFELIATKSHQEQNNLETIEQSLLFGHEEMEVSTQILIKEAQRQNIKVEILDKKSNIIRLSKGRRSHIVRQATKTSLDSYISTEIMHNKEVSKQILREHNIKVPAGGLFHNKATALNAFPDFVDKKLVVKPNDTNYGIGINFVETNDQKQFVYAVNEAFSHSNNVIVEEFIEGKEYRLLVIGNKVVSIVHRLPANVTGDGKLTISELIDQKNEDPKNYKFFSNYYIRKEQTEIKFLKKQKLTLKSIPKKGKTIFLRANSNVSTGGDPIEVLDQIPQKFKDIALQAANAVNAKFCGIDMIIKGNSYSIIEINYNPAIQMHVYPVKGEGKPVAKNILKLLGL
jgi:glutamate--cysteine ligase